MLHEWRRLIQIL